MKPTPPAQAVPTDLPDQQGGLPHERDQDRGTDPNSGVQSGTRDIIRQAHDDIESGQEDTDMHDQRSLEKKQREA